MSCLVEMSIYLYSKVDYVQYENEVFVGIDTPKTSEMQVNYQAAV